MPFLLDEVLEHPKIESIVCSLRTRDTCDYLDNLEKFFLKNKSVTKFSCGAADLNWQRVIPFLSQNTTIKSLEISICIQFLQCLAETSCALHITSFTTHAIKPDEAALILSLLKNQQLPNLRIISGFRRKANGLWLDNCSGEIASEIEALLKANWKASLSLQDLIAIELATSMRGVDTSELPFHSQKLVEYWLKQLNDKPVYGL